MQLGKQGPYLHDAIGVVDHVRGREEHTTAPHKVSYAPIHA